MYVKWDHSCHSIKSAGCRYLVKAIFLIPLNEMKICLLVKNIYSFYIISFHLRPTEIDKQQTVLLLSKIEYFRKVQYQCEWTFNSSVWKIPTICIIWWIHSGEHRIWIKLQSCAKYRTTILKKWTQIRFICLLLYWLEVVLKYYIHLSNLWNQGDLLISYLYAVLIRPPFQ